MRFRRLREICQRSYWVCMPSHSSGVVPRASDNLRAISGEIPAAPFSTRERATRVTLRWLAASVTDSAPRYSRKTLPGCGGLCIRIIETSVIVPIIDQNRIFALECECQSPVTAHVNRPVSFQVACQRVQSPARRIHIGRGFRIVQCKELFSQAIGMFRLNAAF